MKIKDFLNKKIQIFEKYHFTKQTRIKFTLRFWLFFTLCILLFCTVGAMFTLYGVSFKQGDGSDAGGYIVSPNVRPWALAIGIIVFFIAIGFSIYTFWYMPIMFIESKIIHLKTPYFKKESIKYSHEYLRTLNLKQLKWVKKLGYIDKAYFMILKKEKLSK